MISECTVKRLGDLPFDFIGGTCGTFIIDNSPTIILCFDLNEQNLCRSFTRISNDALSEVTNFVSEAQFDLDKISIANSTYEHFTATIANYQGFPLVLGGNKNNRLEMLDTMQNPALWVNYYGTEYPYLNM